MKEKRSDTWLLEEFSRVNNELVNVQRELTKKNAQLMSMNEEKNRFVGMAAHDLRTPLGVILTYSEFLEEETHDVLTEEHRDFVATIVRTSRSMLDLVEDLLDVATIESGVVTLRREPVQIVDLVARSTRMHAALAAAKGIEVTSSAEDDVPRIEADPAKLEQVMNNLLGNAIKFSESGTAVHVHVAMASGSVMVRVADQGPGIPEPEQQHLFKPFVQTSVQATDEEKGAGLGLSIVRRIVEVHGGDIGVVSSTGSGSTFWFSLPTGP